MVDNAVTNEQIDPQNVSGHSHPSSHLVDALEAFLEMGLHPVNVLGLRQDREELVVGEEVQPREHRALGLKVVA